VYVVLYVDASRLKNPCQAANMKKSNITEADIREALRRTLHMDSLDSISEVYLERTGEISFVMQKAIPA
jgi:uncharacterized membrane protein YcaP (DUF421 family)